jgi:hypothetical protein
MAVVSGVTTTAATAVVCLEGLLWSREEMDVVSGVTATGSTAVGVPEGPPLE